MPSVNFSIYIRQFNKNLDVVCLTRNTAINMPKFLSTQSENLIMCRCELMVHYGKITG